VYNLYSETFFNGRELCNTPTACPSFSLERRRKRFAVCSTGNRQGFRNGTVPLHILLLVSIYQLGSTDSTQMQLQPADKDNSRSTRKTAAGGGFRFSPAHPQNYPDVAPPRPTNYRPQPPTRSYPPAPPPTPNAPRLKQKPPSPPPRLPHKSHPPKKKRLPVARLYPH
jgi:hypothetical protein